MRVYRLTRWLVPGVADNDIAEFWRINGGDSETLWSPAQSIPEINCELYTDAYRAKPDTLLPDAGYPVVVICVRDLAAADIWREHLAAARAYIIAAIDAMLTDLALIAPEQETIVLFSDELARFTPYANGKDKR